MKDRSTVLTETVNAILAQGGLDERYRGDFAKLIATAYDAGAATSQVIVRSVALSDGEIAALRTLLK